MTVASEHRELGRFEWHVRCWWMLVDFLCCSAGCAAIVTHLLVPSLFSSFPTQSWINTVKILHVVFPRVVHPVQIAALLLRHFLS